MSWVRGDIYLGERVQVLTISDRMAKMNRMPLSNNAAELPILADWAEDLIARFRPDLGGLIVFAIDFDMTTHSWRFCCHHESFPRVPFGHMAQVLPLTQETQ